GRERHADKIDTGGRGEVHDKRFDPAAGTVGHEVELRRLRAADRQWDRILERVGFGPDEAAEATHATPQLVANLDAGRIEIVGKSDMDDRWRRLAAHDTHQDAAERCGEAERAPRPAIGSAHPMRW